MQGNDPKHIPPYRAQGGGEGGNTPPNWTKILLAAGAIAALAAAGIIYALNMPQGGFSSLAGTAQQPALTLAQATPSHRPTPRPTPKPTPTPFVPVYQRIVPTVQSAQNVKNGGYMACDTKRSYVVDGKHKGVTIWERDAQSGYYVQWQRQSKDGKPMWYADNEMKQQMPDGSTVDTKSKEANPEGMEVDLVLGGKFDSLLLLDDWLYYADIGKGRGMYRIHTQKRAVEAVVPNQACSYIQAAEDWLYYAIAPTKGTQPRELWRVRLDGQERELVLQAAGLSKVSVLGDHCYYVLVQDAHTLYRLPLKESAPPEVLCEEPVTDYAFYQGGLLVSTGTGLYTMTREGKNMKKKSGVRAGEMIVVQDWLLFSDLAQEDGVAALDLLQSKGKKISAGDSPGEIFGLCSNGEIALGLLPNEEHGTIEYEWNLAQINKLFRK